MRPRLAALALLSMVTLSGAAKPAPDPSALVQAAAKAMESGQYRDALKLADTLVAGAAGNSDSAAVGQMLRADALLGLQKPDDSHAAGLAAINGTSNPALGDALIQTYLAVGDPEGAYAVLDRFLARFGDRARDLDFVQVRPLLFWVKDQKGQAAWDALVVRLADGGFGGEDIEGRDYLALSAAKIVAKQGDMDHARALARSLVLRSDVREALTQREYEPLWPLIEESAGPHMERIGRAALIEAGQTYQGNPDSPVARVTLFRAYREAGQFDRADQIAAGFATTPTDLAGIDESGGWLINDHAYLLVNLGRLDAGDARFAALTALPIADHPWLINMEINRAAVLVGHRREAQALPLVESAAKDAETYGSPYARQLIRRLRICALHGLGRDAEAAKLEPDLTAHAADSAAATTDGYFCLGRKSDAIALTIKALGDPDKAGDFIGALQPDGASLDRPDPSLWNGFADQLRADPGVTAALAKAGRPLPQAMWPTPIEP